MNTTIRAACASLAMAGLLAGCATYDYGYGYDRPYYGYGYDRPYYGYTYDYGGPYYYDYGPYYYGAPSIGFGFTYRDHGRRDRHHYDRHRQAAAAHHDHSGRRQANARPAHANPSHGHQGAVARNRVPPAPAPQRSTGSRRAAQATMRAEQ